LKILIIKISSLGDILNSTYVIKAIKNQYPEYIIDMIIDPKYEEIVRNLNVIEKFYYFDESKYSELIKIKKHGIKIISNVFKIIKEIKKQIKEINRENYDVILDLQGIEKSLLYYFFTRAKIKECKWSLPYKNLDVNKNTHAVLALFQVTKKVLKNLNLKYYDYKIKDAKIEEKIIDFLKSEQTDIIIGPFTRWQTKNCPIIFLIILSILLCSKGYKITFIGSKQDYVNWNNELNNFENFNDIKDKDLRFFYKSLNLIISNKFPDIVWKNEFNKLLNEKKINIKFGEYSLTQIGILLENSSLFIGPDSFLSHYAHAIGTAQIYLFGPTNALRFGPIKSGLSIVMRNTNLDCLGCHKRKCPKKYDKHILCMKSIEIEDIFNNSIKILNHTKDKNL